MIQTGCGSCGRHVIIESNYNDNTSYICVNCYETKYSKAAKRNKKLNSILKRSLLQRIKSKLFNI